MKSQAVRAARPHLLSAAVATAASVAGLVMASSYIEGAGGLIDQLRSSTSRLFGEAVSGLAFDQAEDEQGQADDGDQRVDAAVVLQVQVGDGERAFECLVAAFDRFLSLVVAQDLFGVGLVSGSRLVSSAYQPSVAASASIAAWSKCQVRVGLPVSGSVPVSCGQVGRHPAGAADCGDPVGDRLARRVVAAAQAAFQPSQIITGPVEFLGPGGGRGLGAGRGVHEDAPQPDNGVAFCGDRPGSWWRSGPDAQRSHPKPARSDRR